MEKIIAILLVMLVINAFLIFAIIKAAKRTDETIRNYFMEKMSRIPVGIGVGIDMEGEETDEVIDAGRKTGKDKKSVVYTKASEVTVNIGTNGQKRIVTEAHADSDLPLNENRVVTSIKQDIFHYKDPDGKVISYKDMDFKDEYKNLKEKMNLNKRDIVFDVIRNLKKVDTNPLYPYIASIKRRFSFDMIYNINTLPTEHQITVMRETLLDKEQTVLDYYLQEECRENEFSAVDFFSYIDQQDRIYDETIYIYTGEEDEDFSNIRDNTETIVDKEICEGLKILYRNKLYDYSI